MNTLFDNNLNGSDIYKVIRDNTKNKILRNHLNDLWSQYKPYADHGFVKKFSIEVYQRFWEMLLGCKLLDLGFELATKQQKNESGLDLCILGRDKKIWVEATVPMTGVGMNAVPLLDDSYSKAFRIPEKEIILRYCSSVDKKREQFLSYLKKGYIEPNDSCVIAINSCALPFEYMTDSDDIPFAVQSVFPVSNLSYTYCPDSKTFSDPFLQRREELNKQSGKQVPTYAFLDNRFANISGLIFSDERLGDFNNLEQTNLSFIHNKKAKCVLPKGWLRKGQEWWWVDNQLLHRYVP